MKAKIIDVSSFKSTNAMGVARIEVETFSDGVSVIRKVFLSDKELGEGFTLLTKKFGMYLYEECIGFKYDTLMTICAVVNERLTKNNVTRKDIKR